MESYSLGRPAIRQLRRLVRESMFSADPARQTMPPLGTPAHAVYIAKTGASGIAAASGTTPGSGTVTLQQITSGGVLADLKDGSGTSVTETAYNISPMAIAESAYVQLTQELVSGALIVAAGGARKLYCRFTLDAALATTDASKAGTIVTQYGPGGSHTTTSITVYNLLTHTAGTYVFEGDSGDAGYAFWDSGTSWRIMQMECP